MALTKTKDILGNDVWVEQGTNKIFTKNGTNDTYYVGLDAWNKRQQDSVKNPNSKNYQGSSKSTSKTSSKTNTSNVSTISSLMPSTPTLDLNKIYQDSLNDPELQKLQSDLNTKKQALATAQSNINDNPFYSEATRTGKLQKLETSANNDISLLDSQVAQKKADAQVKLNIAQNQYSIDTQAYNTNLSKLNTLISSGALVNASSGDIAQIAVATGLTTGMINSMIQKIKTEAVKPTVIQNTDDNGNVTVSVIDGNTGKVISQNSLGKVDKSAKSTTTSTSTGINKTKVSDKDVAVAMSIIDKQDNANFGTKDKQLSSWEISSAINELVAKYGNTDTAYELLAEAMNRGGYSEWGG